VRPIDLMFSSYQRRILALLLLRPHETFHVREISRLTGTPAGSLHRELKTLAEAGLLTREPLGNQVRYRADPSSPIFPELAEIFRKTVGLADVLRDCLSPLLAKMEFAFVFGSLARGEERATSDVDVFILGDISFAKVVEAFMPLQSRLGREVNPVLMSTTEFRIKVTERDRFVSRVLKEQKLFVIGTEDDFKRLIENRSAQRTRAKR
jgi:predicted nucleotidyltransferase